MRLSQAVSPTRTIPVEFDGGAVLTVTYRPATYTVRELKMMEANARDVEQIVDSMLRTLVSWDLESDDGSPIPADDREALLDVPTNVYVTIMQAMQKDQQPGEADAPSVAG